MGILIPCEHGVTGVCVACDSLQAQRNTASAIREQTRSLEQQAVRDRADHKNATDRAEREKRAAEKKSRAVEARAAAADSAAQYAERERARVAEVEAERAERHRSEERQRVEDERTADAAEAARLATEASIEAEEAVEDAEAARSALAATQTTALEEGRTLTPLEELEIQRAATAAQRESRASARRDVEARRRSRQEELAFDAEVVKYAREADEAEQSQAQSARLLAQQPTASKSKPTRAPKPAPPTREEPGWTLLAIPAVLLGLWSTYFVLIGVAGLLVIGVVGGYSLFVRRRRLQKGYHPGTGGAMAIALGCLGPYTWSVLRAEDNLDDFGLLLTFQGLAIVLGAISLIPGRPVKRDTPATPPPAPQLPPAVLAAQREEEERKAAAHQAQQNELLAEAALRETLVRHAVEEMEEYRAEWAKGLVAERFGTLGSSATLVGFATSTVSEPWHTIVPADRETTFEEGLKSLTDQTTLGLYKVMHSSDIQGPMPVFSLGEGEVRVRCDITGTVTRPSSIRESRWVVQQCSPCTAPGCSAFRPLPGEVSSVTDIRPVEPYTCARHPRAG